MHGEYEFGGSRENFNSTDGFNSNVVEDLAREIWSSNTSFPERPPVSGDESTESSGKMFMMTNGDEIEIGSHGIKIVDSEGNRVERVREIETPLAGTSKYELSNGAIYTSGCFTDSISYSNGDRIAFTRSGRVISGLIDGRELE